MSEYQKWWDSLPEHTKAYFKSQPIYRERDLGVAIIWGAVVGFIVGVVVGYEWAYEPVVRTFRPLMG